MSNDTSVRVDASLWIGGHEAGADLARRSVFSPIDGRELGSYPVGGESEADRALTAAQAARRAWAATTPFERADSLDRIAELILERRASLELLLTLEQGKPLAESAGEVDETVAHFRIAAAATRNLEGILPASADPNKRNLVVRVPRGVAVAIQPWNFPLAVAGQHIAPALGGGNAVVMLPAPTTTLVAHEFARCILDAGLADGVFNFVAGDGRVIGEALTGDPRANAVAFTGSPATGQRVASNAAGRAVLLELGGNGPIIILEDADIDRAVEGVIASAFIGSGQACTAAELVLVHEDIHDAFAEALTKAVTESVVLGVPTEETTTIGPLHNEDTAAKMDRHVEDALERGARILLGGSREKDRPTNLYWQATVLADVTGEMVVAQEETFGPIIPLRKIKSAAEALEIAEDNGYGLAASVYTRDIGRGLRLAEQIPAGTVMVNEMSIWTELHLPFGGVAGTQSGIGRLQGKYALEDVFTELKTIVVHLPEE